MFCYIPGDLEILNQEFKRKMYIHTPRRVHYSIRIRTPCEEHKVVLYKIFHYLDRREKEMYTIATLDQRLERNSPTLPTERFFLYLLLLYRKIYRDPPASCVLHLLILQNWFCVQSFNLQFKLISFREKL